MKPTADCSPRVKLAGRFAIAGNGVAALSILLFDYQSGGHGEMGSFYHSILLWIFLFAGWGVATGIGLLQAWRWARISALIFSALLALGGILGVVAFLGMPAGGLSGGAVLIFRVVSSLLGLIPVAIGLWWLVFFNRKDVKEYFQAN